MAFCIVLNSIVCIIVALLCAAVSISSSSPIENDLESKFLLLTTRVDALQLKMGQILNQLEEEKLHRVNLQALNHQLESKIHDLSAKNQKQEEGLRLLTNKNTINHESAQLETKSLSKLPPSSCRQLSTIGHYLDGIYLIANPDSNNIESVYCTFGTSISETLYGNVDVKTKSVHFYVQRKSNFVPNNVIIPFEVERLNVGGAMNLATGVFTVPVDGIYHFEFSGMRDADTNPLGVNLQVNGVDVAGSYAANLGYFNGLSGINASLRLKTGDQVALYKTIGVLHDDSPWSHFTGWLAEEDLQLFV